MSSAIPALLSASLQAGSIGPLPAETPIGGPLWSLVVPALLLAIAAFGTFLLYRHFARREK
jgi:hypothetical protein